MIIWILLLIVVLIDNGFPKDNSYLKKIGIRYAIIYIFIYALIEYGLGFFIELSRSIYSHTFKNLFNNIFPVLIMLISREIIRYIFCKKSNGNTKSLIFITFTIVLYELVAPFLGYNLLDNEQLFIFICIEVFGLIAKNSLYTYLTYHTGLIPSLIITIVMEIYIYILPLLPYLGNYIKAALGILMPYYLYLKTKKVVKYGDKQNIEKINPHFLTVSIFIIIVFVFILISGIGKYRMIAIASNSMQPIYSRGDAVIYSKEDASNINKGDILVFKSDNNIITHRVTNIIKKGNKIYFQTKGDNNTSADIDLVDDSNVYGKVKYIVKYIGYPTIKLQEMKD